MTAKTRLGYEGYGVRRAGSFAGKTITATVTLALAATESPDIFAFTGAFFASRWTPAVVQSEAWTPAIKQAETWTPK